MKNRVLWLVLFFSVAVTNISWRFEENKNLSREDALPPISATNYKINANENELSNVYDSLHLADKGLTEKAFDYAIEGHNALEEKGMLENDSVITIIDFDQPSYKKRMYVIDIKHYKLLFHTFVAHGKNSGGVWAASFSNSNESNKSSLGFYITERPYQGINGYSLKLVGIEQNINTNALQRGIVVHGANYVSARAEGSPYGIGRSHGCPAVAPSLNKPIISTIKNGSCFFIYNKKYRPSSSVLQNI